MSKLKELRVYGEKVLAVIRKTDNYMLVETETVFYILAYDAEKEKGVPVVGMGKMVYDLDEAIQEFEDFVRC